MKKQGTKELDTNEVGKKIIWANDLRAFSTIAVIVLHASAPLLNKNEFDSAWWIGNIFDSSVRFCVPIFIMLTGSLLIPKNTNIKDYFQRRFSKIILPFIFWTIIYICYNLISKYLHQESLTFTEEIYFILNQIMFGSSYHLWFVYMIVSLYLILPIIGKWARNSSENEISYFILIWLATIIFSQPYFFKLKSNFDLSFFSGFSGYLLLGHYLTIKKFRNRKKIILISYFLILAGIVATLAGTYHQSINRNSLDESFYGYLTPNVLAVSIGIFLLFKEKGLARHPQSRKLWNFISEHSYGIYLVHVLALILINKAGIFSNQFSPIVVIPLTVVLCLSISACVIYLFNKLPLGRYFSG